MFSQIRSCSGKERTAEISDKAQRLGLKAEAVEYCITYREDGVCGGEAFLPSDYEQFRLAEKY